MMAWLALIPVAVIAVWVVIRSLRSKELHEISRERRLMLLSMHEAKPKPFRMIRLDRLRFRGAGNDKGQKDG
tara:strand:- start:1583 stop:1798 length:216 start_codon:yes stop_codon:yes gene_type:complete